MDILLVTSNNNKLNELIRLGLPISGIKNIDLPEVLADPMTVALYKSLEAGSNTIVEDTVLRIDNNNIVDIRWRIHEMNGLSENSTISWLVTLAHNDGNKINIYSGEIPCKINPKSLSASYKKEKDGFGFDEYLIPQINDKKGIKNKLTFYELERKGLKDFFSARKLAVDNFVSGTMTNSVLLAELSPWSGKIQEG